MLQNYNPRYFIYDTYKIRLYSFRHYWSTVNLRAAVVWEMADAGFFYCGNGINDRAACFSCGGVIEDWEIHKDPWRQHAALLPKCLYLNSVKGRDYIEQIYLDNK